MLLYLAIKFKKQVETVHSVHPKNYVKKRLSELLIRIYPRNGIQPKMEIRRHLMYSQIPINHIGGFVPSADTNGALSVQIET